MAQAPAPATDAYGAEAAELLAAVQPLVPRLAERVTERFYRSLRSMDTLANVLDRLNESEFARLKSEQARHVAELLSPQLTRSAHRTVAAYVGRVHALIGVDVKWLVEAYNILQEELFKELAKAMPAPASRELLLSVVCQRILLDLQGQVESFSRMDVEMESAFARLDEHVMSAANLPDLVRETMAVIGSLDGALCAFFARPDESGALQVEQSHGPAAERYHKAMEAGEVPYIHVDAGHAAAHGPGGRAWREREIVIAHTWGRQSEYAPWRRVGAELGFRSSAAVPLLDEAGSSVALLNLYSGWPGYFSTTRIGGFLRHVQRVLSHALQQWAKAPVIPMRERQTYRRMLDDDQVVMLYQPIIGLRDGSLVKIEALARLRTAGDELVAPGRFLPAFGRDELLKLFIKGLHIAAHDCRALDDAGLRVQVAVNLPAEGFGDPRYERHLFEGLARARLPAERLQLEILETEEGGDGDEGRHGFVQRLREAGVQIAQDDLGSGHSSLLRLHRYPFDEVKIDQGLVRGTLQNPKHSVEFILYLTRLAHAFDIPVTVEGLENPGMVEAAAILGADRGQGYGIARPMPAARIAAWYGDYRFDVLHHAPRTALGAMAGYLLWDLQLGAIAERPELIEEFVGAKAIVDRFVDTRSLHDSALGRLIRRSHELAAGRGVHGENARSLRRQVLDTLAEHWLDEAGS